MVSFFQKLCQVITGVNFHRMKLSSSGIRTVFCAFSESEEYWSPALHFSLKIVKRYELSDLIIDFCIYSTSGVRKTMPKGKVNDGNAEKLAILAKLF